MTRATATLAAVVGLLLWHQTIVAPRLEAQTAAPENAARWRATLARDAETITALGARVDGSAAESATVDYLIGELAELGLTPRRHTFSEADFAHSFSSIVDVTIAGVRPDVLVVAVPLAAARAAGFGSSTALETDATPAGLALALAFARDVALAERPPPVSVRFVFLGAERGDPVHGYPLGSRLFLHLFQPTAPVAVVYLDLDRPAARLVIKTGGSSGAAAPWLIERTAAALNAGGQRFRITPHITQLVRLGLVREPLLEPFLQAGYPALRLAGQGAPRDDAAGYRWLDRMHGFFPQFLAGFGQGIPETWERHYLLFQGLGSFLIVPEPAYLIGLIIVLSIAVSYAFVVPHRFVRYLWLVRTDGWRIVLIAALTFGALSGGTAILKLLLEVRGIPTLWEVAPVLLLTLKGAIALLLVCALIRLPWWRRFPVLGFAPVGGFYGAAAILVLILELMASAGINITLTFYFAWAFGCALLASLARNRWVKLIWIALAPYWIARAVGGLVLLPVLPFVQTVLLSTVNGDLVSTVVLLPFVLLVMRAVHGFVDHRRDPRAAYRYPLWLIGAISGLALVAVGSGSAILTINPYGPGREQPLSARTVIDQDTRSGALTLSSPAPIGWVEVTFAGTGRSLNTRERALTMPLEPVSDLVRFEEWSTGALGGRSIAITFMPEGTPNAILLTLDSSDRFDLLEANYPFRRRGAGSYEILVGARPPNPLAIELTVPHDLMLALHYAVDYDRSPLELTIESPRKEITSSLRVAGSIAIST